MLTTILIITAILYSAELIFLYIGLIKSERNKTVEDYSPTVSVIVAARDEEKYIAECLNSLVQLDYPPEKIELIIVNDGSTDRTSEIIESYSKKYPLIKMINTKPGKGNLRGKSNAVAQGIDTSSGDILMFTDADCVVPPKWISNTVKYFNSQVGIVGGFTLLKPRRAFEGIQTLDWIFLFSIASATAGWNLPLTVIGNNLSIRRTTYLQTGGFKEIPFSVTEDYALVHAVLKKTKYRISFPISIDALVQSKPCPDWKSLFRQKQRWGVGGLNMVFRGFVVMAIGWTAKLMLIFSAIFSPSLVLLVAFILMLLSETIFLLKPLQQFHAKKYLKYLPIFFVYLCLYVLIIPFIALFTKQVIWKERNL